MRYNWTVSVDLVLESSVKMLLLDRVWHNDQEEIIIILIRQFLSTVLVLTANISAVIVVNCIFKGFDARSVAQLYNVAIIDIDVKLSLF